MTVQIATLPRYIERTASCGLWSCLHANRVWNPYIKTILSSTRLFGWNWLYIKSIYSETISIQHSVLWKIRFLKYVSDVRETKVCFFLLRWQYLHYCPQAKKHLHFAPAAWRLSISLIAVVNNDSIFKFCWENIILRIDLSTKRLRSWHVDVCCTHLTGCDHSLFLSRFHCSLFLSSDHCYKISVFS